jgi:hypothetical protein
VFACFGVEGEVVVVVLVAVVAVVTWVLQTVKLSPAHSYDCTFGGGDAFNVMFSAPL